MSHANAVSEPRFPPTASVHAALNAHTARFVRYNDALAEAFDKPGHMQYSNV